MTCSHCVLRVTEALTELDEVMKYQTVKWQSEERDNAEKPIGSNDKQQEKEATPFH